MHRGDEDPLGRALFFDAAFTIESISAERPKTRWEAETKDADFQIRSSPPQWRVIPWLKNSETNARSSFNSLSHSRDAANRIVLAIEQVSSAGKDSL